MRIIGGEFKSRKLHFPKSKLTRPMSDRTKETLFNMINADIPGSRILDLYSGSGSVGLEALSRGALDATFVDQADWALKSIRKNLIDLDVEHRGFVVPMEVFQAIKKFEKEGMVFSIIFVDPPFNEGLVKKTLNRLDHSAILAPFAQVIVGHASQEKAPEQLENLKLAKTKKIGQAYLSFYIRMESDRGETQSNLPG
jgi:16S rRNA (guanine966-N2)-methyltransferase